ncbi:HisH Glutamine amidotransferase [actinobacterium SCGC AAA044-D11]
MIAILDYGSGNLRSAERAFQLASEKVVVTNDPQTCLEADGLVVPGVGAFAACMDQLIGVGGDDIIANRIAKSMPIFGICVGMQIFFDSSSEKGVHKGLGALAGEVSKISAPILPHMGWNTVLAPSNSLLFKGVENEPFYFVHSFAAKSEIPGALNTTSNYGENFIAAVERENLVATQFHPEKSGSAGATLISNWVKSL